MQKTVKQRIKVISLGLVFLFPLIVIRLFYIQVIYHDYYQREANANSDRCRIITPRRGAFYERTGNQLLAKTAPSHNIMVIPQQAVSQHAQVYLSALLSKFESEVVSVHEIKTEVKKKLLQCKKYVQKKLAKHAKIKGSKKYKKLQRNYSKDYYNRKYLLRKKISLHSAIELFCQQKAWVNKNCRQAEIVNKVRGFDLAHTVARHYPQADFLPHILGNVGAISAKEYRDRSRDYRLNDIIGRKGLEALYEEQLRGQRACFVETPQSKFFELPMDGKDIILCIDAQLQNLAEQALDRACNKFHSAHGGAAVVIDVTNGDILTLATSPRYDNQNFANNYLQYVKDPRRPLNNRAIGNYYPTPPGSVFKIMVALYALEQGIIDENTTYFCRGYLKRPGSFRCTHYHGRVNIVEAIEGSCNIFFYHLGEIMGLEALRECAQLFGYGKQSNLRLPGEQCGYLPSRSTQKWYPGNNRMFAIGQIMQATPLQVANAMSMVANKGSMPALRLVKKIRQPNYYRPQSPNRRGEIEMVAAYNTSAPSAVRIVRNWPIRQKHWLMVKEGMRRVVEGAHGTAKNLIPLLDGVRIASKTGTSQVKGEDHAWFAGFAPLHNPKYAFAVFIEHGGYGGRAAGPIAAELMRYLCKAIDRK